MSKSQLTKLDKKIHLYILIRTLSHGLTQVIILAELERAFGFEVQIHAVVEEYQNSENASSYTSGRLKLY